LVSGRDLQVSNPAVTEIEEYSPPLVEQRIPAKRKRTNAREAVFPGKKKLSVPVEKRVLELKLSHQEDPQPFRAILPWERSVLRTRIDENDLLSALRTKTDMNFVEFFPMKAQVGVRVRHLLSMHRTDRSSSSCSIRIKMEKCNQFIEKFGKQYSARKQCLTCQQFKPMTFNLSSLPYLINHILNAGPIQWKALESVILFQEKRVINV
jgi:hypothetical protein